MHKDLGIIVISNLKVAEHCLQACSKASKMLGLVIYNHTTIPKC